MAKRTKKANTKVVKPEEQKPEVTNNTSDPKHPENSLTYEQAMEEIKSGGGFVKLPEWGGYWAKGNDENPIMVVTKDGEELNTPHHETYKDRTDWQITDGKTPEITKPFVPASTEEVEAINEEEVTPEGPSKSLDKILGDVHAGKKVKIKSEKGVHFIYSGDGRLNKYDDKTGSFLESAPLYSFQDKDGWEVVD